ncbi:MAG: nucleotide-diphospho-sugar transferase [Flavobacteriales bacterium]|nr:nucleotide-diphospho-sugar transferase [Flavobacteriales bacterium]
MSTPFIPPGPLNTPVLFIAFNRYDTALKVFEAIRQARPPRLYFACDGARNETEKAKCAQVRSLVERVDWPCEVLTKFSDVNLGVKMGEATAMTWFWEHEEMGIVLEDDTLPVQSFFWYCEELLHHYKDDDRVWCIMGNNLMTEWEVKGSDSYYFSTHGYGAYWGWAGWRRVWRKYDVDMKEWPAVKEAGIINGHFISKAEMAEAYGVFDNTYDGNIRSWDFQFDFGRIVERGVNIIPNVNMIRNVGFGAGGTNTVSENDVRNKDVLMEIGLPLHHPRHMMVDVVRDHAHFKRYVQPTGLRRFKNAIKSLLPKELDEAVTPFFSRLQKSLGIH